MYNLGPQIAITNPQITKKIGSTNCKVPHLKKVQNLTNYLHPQIIALTICGPPIFALITFLIKLYLNGARYRLTSGRSLATVTSSLASVRLASVK